MEPKTKRPERPDEQQFAQTVRSLCEQMEEETTVWSGGFERAAPYREIMALGAAAIPYLVEELRERHSETRRLNSWWRIQIISELAQGMGNPIDFPPEAAGRLHEVRDRVISWAEANGHAFIDTDNQ